MKKLSSDEKQETSDESTEDTAETTSSAMLLNEGYILNHQNNYEDDLQDDTNVLKKVPSFSIEWKSLRGVTQCSCGSPIDYLTRKVSIYR